MFHNHFGALRNVPYFRITTPKLSFKDFINPSIDFKPPPFLTVGDMYKLGKYPKLDTSQADLINMFIVDQDTAIPFVILNSPRMEETAISKDIILVVNDILDSFTLHLQFFKELIAKSKNTKVILFNLPGQAYTLFNPEKTYDNIYMGSLLDLFLYNLDRREEVNCAGDNLKLIGYGYGANIVTYYLANLQQAVYSIRLALLINPFTHIDATVDSFLTQLEEMGTQPNFQRETLFTYFRSLVSAFPIQKEELEHLLLENPIKPEGLCALVAGCKASVDVRQMIRQIKKVSMVIVYSMNNTLVNPNHVAVYTQLNVIDDSVEEFQKRVRSGMKISEFVRMHATQQVMLIYAPFSYDIQISSPTYFQNMLSDFVSCQLDRNYIGSVVACEMNFWRIDKQLGTLVSTDLESLHAGLMQFQNTNDSKVLDGVVGKANGMKSLLEKYEGQFNKQYADFMALKESFPVKVLVDETAERTVNYIVRMSHSLRVNMNDLKNLLREVVNHLALLRTKTQEFEAFAKGFDEFHYAYEAFTNWLDADPQLSSATTTQLHEDVGKLFERVVSFTTQAKSMEAYLKAMAELNTRAFIGGGETEDFFTVYRTSKSTKIATLKELVSARIHSLLAKVTSWLGRGERSSLFESWSHAEGAYNAFKKQEKEAGEAQLSRVTETGPMTNSMISNIRRLLEATRDGYYA
jgi:hypothetical protein